MIKKKPKVTLVGAGPGDPELISLAGIRALKDADVVLYDALVNPQLLVWSRNAKKIFVGKRKGYKRYSQETINHLLVSEALMHGHVIRLKGGDSFIFGRGGEEVDFIHSFDIETKVIPGISSATSASVTQGIPLTKRGVTESFWVITGTTRSNKLSEDIRLASKSTATIVILMGISKLEQIIEVFRTTDRSNDSICIIQNAYQPKEKSIVGSINTIQELVKQQSISNPAVIVIGDVVKHGTKTKEYFSLNQLIKK